MKAIRTKGMGRRGPIPHKRRRIEEWVRKQAALGRIAPGERLPDRTWFQRKFKATPVSVQEAFAALKDDGFVTAVPGLGTRLADPLPFVNRYLLLLKSCPDDAGLNYFVPALRAASLSVAKRRGVSFDCREGVDSNLDSQAYAQIVDDVRLHRYAGVFAQDISWLHDADSVMNVDDVPISFLAEKNELAQGSLVVEPEGMRDVTLVLRNLFDDCREAGKTNVALFFSTMDQARRDRVRLPLCAKCGLRLVPNGFHTVDVNRWNQAQFERLVALFLASDAGRQAESVVLGDDNFLLPFVSVCRRMLGPKADRRYFIACHCNFPYLPKTDFPVAFHGYDLDPTIDSFVDYAEDCWKGVRKPRLPRLVVR